jgi:hypothetical protein
VRQEEIKTKHHRMGHANSESASIPLAGVPCQKLNRRETFMIYQFSFDSIGFCFACLSESALLFAFFIRPCDYNQLFCERFLSDFLRTQTQKAAFSYRTHLAHRCTRFASSSDWHLFGTCSSRDPIHAAA